VVGGVCVTCKARLGAPYGGPQRFTEAPVSKLQLGTVWRGGTTGTWNRRAKCTFAIDLGLWW
jgi:hypothetical protein